MFMIKKRKKGEGPTAHRTAQQTAQQEALPQLEEYGSKTMPNLF